MLNPLKALFPSRDQKVRIVTAPRRRTSLAPAVVLAAGAGAALWWWTQWERGATEDVEGPKTAPNPAPDGMSGVSPVLDANVVEALDESLAVQADAKPGVATA